MASGPLPVSPLPLPPFASGHPDRAQSGRPHDQRAWIIALSATLVVLMGCIVGLLALNATGYLGESPEGEVRSAPSMPTPEPTSPTFAPSPTALPTPTPTPTPTPRGDSRGIPGGRGSLPANPRTQIVRPEGSRIEFLGTGTALDGVAIDFPSGAIRTPRAVTVAEAGVPQPLPAGATRASPELEITTEGLAEFAAPARITLPMQGVTDPSRVVPLYYDSASGAWDLAPVVGYDSERRTITTETVHFSRFVLAEDHSTDPFLDTGFDPLRHGWSVGNTGSYLTPGGNCLGMASYAKWHFSRGSEGLHDAYQDRVAKLAATRAHLAESQFWALMHVTAGLIAEAAAESRPDDLLASTGIRLAAALHITDRPQILLLGGLASLRPVGHAVLVTGFTGTEFEVYDPNSVGERRTIPWSPSNGLGPYDNGQLYSGFHIYGLPGLGADARFADIDSDARSGFLDSADLTVTNPQDGARLTSPILQVEGSVRGRIASATHVVVFVYEHPFLASIVDGRFVASVPVPSRQGDVPIFVLAGRRASDVLTYFGSDTAARALRVNRPLDDALVVTLTWEQDATDVDLYVREPSGSTVWYQNRAGQPGASLDNDATRGYGPEHYSLSPPGGAEADNGTYAVRVHYYSGPPFAEVNVHVDVMFPQPGAGHFFGSGACVIAGASESNSNPASDGSGWLDVGSLRFDGSYWSVEWNPAVRAPGCRV